MADVGLQLIDSEGEGDTMASGKCDGGPVYGGGGGAAVAFSGPPSAAAEEAQGQWKIKTEETAPHCNQQLFQPAAQQPVHSDHTGPLSVSLTAMDDATDSRLVMNEDSMSTNSMSYPESPSGCGPGRYRVIGGWLLVDGWLAGSVTGSLAAAAADFASSTKWQEKRGNQFPSSLASRLDTGVH